MQRMDGFRSQLDDLKTLTVQRTDDLGKRVDALGQHMDDLGKRTDGLGIRLGQVSGDLRAGNEIHRLDVKIDSSRHWTIGIMVTLLALVAKLFFPSL